MDAYNKVMPGLNEDTVQRQEIYCHACGGYVQFDLDTSVNGNHVLKCPNCQHEHCRVVCNGKISDTRWDQRNGAGNGLPTYYISQYMTTYATASTATTVSTQIYLYSASTTGGF